MLSAPSARFLPSRGLLSTRGGVLGTTGDGAGSERDTRRMPGGAASLARAESKRRGGLEARDELARVVREVGAHGGRDRLAGDELLAERIHVRSVVHDAVVEVRSGRQPGGADVADDLLLMDAGAGADVGRDLRQVVVLGLVTGAMDRKSVVEGKSGGPGCSG